MEINKSELKKRIYQQISDFIGNLDTLSYKTKVFLTVDGEADNFEVNITRFPSKSPDYIRQIGYNETTLDYPQSDYFWLENNIDMLVSHIVDDDP